MMPSQDYCFIKKPLDDSPFCGDTGIIREFDGHIFIGIIDVLGHGEEADEVAQEGLDFLDINHRQELVPLIKSLHNQIKGSRGAVVGLCLLNTKTGVLQYVGVGNIAIRTFGEDDRRLVLGEGVVGYMMRTPSVQTTILKNGDVLLLYTDGIKQHFSLDDYQEILEDDAQTIVTRIWERFGKKIDDAYCIALKYKSDKNDWTGKNSH